MKHYTIIDWSNMRIINIDMSNELEYFKILNYDKDTTEKSSKYNEYFDFIDAINDITHEIPSKWLEKEVKK